MDVILTTSRFYLRKITHDDLDDFYELDANPNVHRYLGRNPITTRDQARGYIQYVLDQYEKYDLGRLAVIEIATGEMLGWSGLKYETEVVPEQPYYDLGFRLKEQHWGRGVATETAAACLKWGFETLNLDRICAGADVDNIGSNTVLRRTGLLPKGTILYKGITHNWYELSRGEYRVRKPFDKTSE